MGDIFRCVMSLPQKHNFEMHICGFDFDVVDMEDDSFFLEDRFSTFDRDPKNKKIMVPMNPEGGGCTDSPSGSPTITSCTTVPPN